MRKAYQTDHRLKLTFASSAAGPQESRLRENLSNLGIDVVLLESGGEVYSQETQNLYSGKNIGRNYYELDACRLRYFGGTTNHWGGWCRRLRQIDFMERSWIPSSGWPIQLGDLIGWYEQAEAIVQLAQPDQSYGDTLNNYYKGIASFPFDPNRVVPEVYRFSPPTRFAEGFGRLLKKAQNVRVLLNANAVSVHNNQERTHVEGVRYATLAGQATIAFAPQFLMKRRRGCRRPFSNLSRKLNAIIRLPLRISVAQRYYVRFGSVGNVYVASLDVRYFVLDARS